MGDMTYGGGNRLLIYRLDVEDDAYVINKPDGSAAATSVSDAVLDLNGYIESTDLAIDANGLLKITPAIFDCSDAVVEFLNKYAMKIAGSGGTAPAAKTMEDGSVKGGVSSSASRLLAISCGSPVGSTKRSTHGGAFSVDPTSGSVKQTSSDWTSYSLILNGMAAEYDLVIPEELFPTTHYKIGSGGIGDQTIDEGYPFLRQNLLKQV